MNPVDRDGTYRGRKWEGDRIQSMRAEETSNHRKAQSTLAIRELWLGPQA